jgi:hypothetical protein
MTSEPPARSGCSPVSPAWAIPSTLEKLAAVARLGAAFAGAPSWASCDWIWAIRPATSETLMRSPPAA